MRFCEIRATISGMLLTNQQQNRCTFLEGGVSALHSPRTLTNGSAQIGSGSRRGASGGTAECITCERYAKSPGNAGYKFHYGCYQFVLCSYQQLLKAAFCWRSGGREGNSRTSEATGDTPFNTREKPLGRTPSTQMAAQETPRAQPTYGCVIP